MEQTRSLSSKGEPTRAAQVRWLCRSLKNKDYRDTTISELDSAIDTIDAMNTAVHRERYPEIEEAFDRMSLSADFRHGAAESPFGLDAQFLLRSAARTTANQGLRRRTKMCDCVPDP